MKLEKGIRRVLLTLEHSRQTYWGDRVPRYTCKVQKANQETAMAGEAFPQPLHHHPLGLEWEAGVS